MKKTVAAISILAAVGTFMPAAAFAAVQVGIGRETVQDKPCIVQPVGGSRQAGDPIFCNQVNMTYEQNVRLQELERAVLALQQENAQLRASSGPVVAGADPRVDDLVRRVGVLEYAVELMQRSVIGVLTQVLAALRSQ